MEKKNIRFLALDLDGTLTNDEKIITPRTKSALFAAMQQGVTVILASGRPTVGVYPLAEELELERFGGCILSYNGGRITDCRTGKVLYEKRFPQEWIPAVCGFARVHHAAILTYDRQGIVTESPFDEWVRKEGSICKIPVKYVRNLPAYINFPICKLLMTVDPDRMPQVEPYAHAAFDENIGCFRSTPYFIELVPRGVGKDVSLDSLLKLHGCGPENLMAVGDGMNDLSMIRFAGTGVAMANAEAAVKAQADYVTQADNNHDGVAEAVEKFILN